MRKLPGCYFKIIIKKIQNRIKKKKSSSKISRMAYQADGLEGEKKKTMWMYKMMRRLIWTSHAFGEAE